MSRLEALPNEIIEHIFFYSLNLSLPRASIPLGDALSSNTTKLNILFKAFSSTNSRTLEHRHELNYILPSDAKYKISKFQADILQCRWMTWDFLKIYMETFITKTIVRELRDQRILWQDLKPVEDSAVQAYVHGVLYINTKEDIPPWSEMRPSYDEATEESWDAIVEKLRAQRNAFTHALKIDQAAESEKVLENEDQSNTANAYVTDPDARRNVLGLFFGGPKWSSEYEMFITSSLTIRRWDLDKSYSKAAIGIGPRSGVVIIGSGRGCEGQSGIQTRSCTTFKCLLEGYDLAICTIPDKLLVGPWSTEKLNFLEAMLQYNSHIVDADRQEMAARGLMEAIREANFRAVDMIAAGDIDLQWRDQLSPNYAEPCFCYASFDFGSNTYRQAELEPYVKGLSPRQTLGIPPDTAHLKAAVLERGCREMIVRRLLFAAWQDIDRQDPDIAAWIKEKMDEGDRKGQWLLSQLDDSFQTLDGGF